MTKIKTNNMGTVIREEIGLTDENGNVELEFFLNRSDGLTIQTPETLDAPYQQVWMLSKSDWETIRNFVDEQFKSV